MHKTNGKAGENKHRHKTHDKKNYVQPKLVKADKLAQVTQGVVPRS